MRVFEGTLKHPLRFTILSFGKESVCDRYEIFKISAEGLEETVPLLKKLPT